MRLVAWNCNMALHRKFEALISLNPDVAVICECAEPARLKQKMDLSALEADPVWIGSNPNKGLAVFAFNGYQLSLADVYNPSLRFIAPISVARPIAFSLLAVWAQNASAGITRKGQAGPVRLALDWYQDFLTAGSAVAAGDFNNNVFWDWPGWLINHADQVAILKGYGLVSAYHEIRREQQGKESTPTHYWRDRKKDGPTYHIDYIFLSRKWAAKTREMTVGTFDDWCGSGLSDHVPLIVDVAI